MYLCNFLVNSKTIVHSQYLMISCAHIICHYLKTISNCSKKKLNQIDIYVKLNSNNITIFL